MVLTLLLSLILLASCIVHDRSEEHMSLRVKCRSSMYPISVDCFWTQPPALNATKPTKFITTVGQEDSAETKTCLQVIPRSCSCILDELVLLSKEAHVLNITAIHPEGVTTTLFPFVLEDIIKPNPPLIVSVSPVSVNELEVQWSPPYSWPFPDKYRLKYKLSYKPCKSHRFRKLGPTEDTTLRIKAVHRKSQYCIQVNSQHYLGYGKPSEWSPSTVSPITGGVLPRSIPAEVLMGPH